MVVHGNVITSPYYHHMAETPRDYLPGESNKMEHAIERTNKESKQQDVYFVSLQILWFFCKKLDILFNS